MKVDTISKKVVAYFERDSAERKSGIEKRKRENNFTKVSAL